jgi:hypothetical protein
MSRYTRLVHLLRGTSAAAALLAGCGDSDSHVQQGEFQSKIVHALCDNVQNCCRAAGRGFDALNCHRTVVQTFVVPLTDTSLLYDSKQAGGCVQAVTQAAQACQSVDVSTCYDAFVGMLPPGSACRTSFECAAGPSGYAVCGSDGTCAQPPRGMPGQACAYTCIDDGGTPHCRSVFYGVSAATQAACHTQDGLVCIAGSNGVGTCQPAALDCKQNPEQSCPAGQMCDVESSRCYTPVAVGGACAPGVAICGPGGYCAAGLCYPSRPNASMCTVDVECASGKCEKGFCVVYSKAAADWCGEVNPL